MTDSRFDPQKPNPNFKPVEIRGDRVTVDSSIFGLPPGRPGVPGHLRRGTWPAEMRKLDIRARLAGRKHGAKYRAPGGPSREVQVRAGPE